MNQGGGGGGAGGIGPRRPKKRLPKNIIINGDEIYLDYMKDLGDGPSLAVVILIY